MAARTVWKQTLAVIDGYQEARMPTGATIVHVGDVDNEPDHVELWFTCDPLQPVETRTFAITGTGHLVPPTGEHVGTVVFPRARLVWHVWECL